jgi:phosphohistidine phosphatase
MKRLYILRHANAASPAGTSDIDRPLDSSGVDDAKALGNILRSNDLIPSQIYCSPALRTRQTLESLSLNEITSPVLLIEPLYDATAGQMLEIIQDCPDSVQSLLVIGHNPTVHELVSRLTSEDSPLSLIKRLMLGYKPATLSVLDCPCQCWNDLQLGENSLINFLEPLDYNAPSRPTRWM